MTTTSQTQAQDEIRRAELEAIRRELGLVGMIRYLQQTFGTSGDYTAERAKLLGNPTVDEIFAAIEKRRAAKAKEEEDS